MARGIYNLKFLFLSVSGSDYTGRWRASICEWRGRNRCRNGITPGTRDHAEQRQEKVTVADADKEIGKNDGGSGK